MPVNWLYLHCAWPASLKFEEFWNVFRSVLNIGSQIIREQISPAYAKCFSLKRFPEKSARLHSTPHITKTNSKVHVILGNIGHSPCTVWLWQGRYWSIGCNKNAGRLRASPSHSHARLADAFSRLSSKPNTLAKAALVFTSWPLVAKENSTGQCFHWYMLD